MINILNIQFGKSKNNTNKVKTIYNQGDIITARPRTANFPYKILSVKEFPKSNIEEFKKTKKPAKLYLKSHKNNVYTYNQIYTIKRSFSFKNNKKNELKSNNKYNQSSIENNYSKFSYNNYKNELYDDKKNKHLLSDFKDKKKTLTEIDSNTNEFILKPNKKLFFKRGKSDTKKRISRFNINKYNEYYKNNEKEKKNKNNNNKSLNILENENSNNICNNILKNNKNDNVQIINFLSEIINSENLKNNKKNNNRNYNNYFYTTNSNYNNTYKNQDSTRNLIYQKHYDNNKKSFSYNKKTKNEIRPIIINVKGPMGLLNDNNKNNNYLINKKLYDNKIRLRKIKYLRMKKNKNKSGNKSLTYRPLTANYKKKIMSIDIDIDKEKEEDKNNLEKFKNKDKSKKKFKFKKESKNRIKKNKILKKNGISKEFKKYLNNIKNNNFRFNHNSNDYRGNEYKKNYDIYDYLVLPKESGKIMEDTINKNYKEFKSIEQ